MINQKYLFTLCFVLFLSVFLNPVASAQADNPALFDDEAEIQKLLNENKIPALGIGVIRDGKLKQVKVFGELKTGEAAAYDTVFNVASLTKPITAMVALRLVSFGQMELGRTTR
jgi:CubicO group peptidase (beta-lactamase class C family)